MTTKAKAGSHGRTFSQLEEAYSKAPEENRKNFYVKIFKTYATSSDEWSISKVCKEFNIAKSAFDRIANEVIKEDMMITDKHDEEKADKIIRLAREKAKRNQQRNCAEAGRTSDNKYAKYLANRAKRRAEKEQERLEKQREEKDKEKIEECKRILSYLSISPKTWEEFAKEYNYTLSDIEEMISFCLIKGAIDSEMIDALRIQKLNSVRTDAEKKLVKRYFDHIQGIYSCYQEGYSNVH